MDVVAKLINFRFQIILSVVSSLLILGLIYKAPSLIAYFSPLLLSTTIFILTVVVFSHTAPPAPDSDSDSTGINAGDCEGYLDYVASTTEGFGSYIPPTSQPEEKESQHPHADADADADVDDSHQSE